MTELPDFKARDREIPPGKVLLAEYADVGPDEPRAEIQPLEHRAAWGGSTMVRLVVRCAGWAIAGSCMRWDNGAVGVLWNAPDGTQHGQWFRDYQPARELFDRIPS